MHDVKLVKVSQAANKFLHDNTALRFREAAARAWLFKKTQISAVAELCKKVKAGVSLIIFAESNNVWTFDHREILNLILDEELCVSIEFVSLDHFAGE